ncbi:conserved protein, unknown function [Hepatocystis sp. ex Piliocolobus tephrosceles]|nr:conserved protein, unknown function [Hepatocystis sp. ex Piliocolobus tephrosceles]
MNANNKTVFEFNDIKKYYNQVFTKELLLRFEKEINIEKLIYSYFYYFNLYIGNNDIEKDTIESDYLDTDDEFAIMYSDTFNKNIKLRTYDENSIRNNNNYLINYFDPNIDENTYEKKIENTFSYLNNFLISLYTDSNDNSKKLSENEIINNTFSTINVNEGKEEDKFVIFDIDFDKVQINELTLIIMAYIIRSIFNLPLGRKLIFSNINNNNLLLKSIIIQNIYIQIFILRNLKKYLMDDGESYDNVHLKMIKICLFSKSLCSFNYSNKILLYLINQNKQIQKIFDFYFLKKLTIQRLRLLEFITECLNSNNETICNIFSVNTQKNYHSDFVSNKNDKDFEELMTTCDKYEDVDGKHVSGGQQQNKTDINEYMLSLMDPIILQNKMQKYNLTQNDVYNMTKINLYKYLIILYSKNDLLLKINVLEIFNKLVQTTYCSNSILENCYFLYIVLIDLYFSNDELLHTSILNSLISDAQPSKSIIHVLMNAHSNILIKKIIEYVQNDSNNINDEKLVVGIKAFGYFFSFKDYTKLFLTLNPNIHLMAINKISTHSNTNLLKHAINIWIKIIASECMNKDWYEMLIHNLLFNKIIIILKEIDDNIIHRNIFDLLTIIIKFDIINLILNEQWLIKSLQVNSKNDTYELKISKYNFFKLLYEQNKHIIATHSYEENIMQNFLKNLPKMY